MNDDERALRDAFLAECWRPVREWQPTVAEQVAAAERAELLAGVDEPVDDAPEVA